MPAIRRALLLPLSVLLLALTGLVAGPLAPSATAQGGGVEEAAAALRKDPVYVHPQVTDAFPAREARELSETIREADKPVFVAVLPGDHPDFQEDTVLRDLRSLTGISGVYAVDLGDRLGAAADTEVMSENAVANLRGAAQRANDDDTPDQLATFTDQALQQADGRAPDSWEDTGADGQVPLVGLVTLGCLLLLLLGGGLLVRRRGRRRKAEQEQAQLAKLRVVVDEDITAFGERLSQVAFDPTDPAADDAMRADYTHALDAYESAKTQMEAARHPDDVQGVTKALEEGRFSLATLEARRAGGELPERRGPCFFDPRHGPSVADVEWAPPGGAPREVPVCAADAARVREGEEPLVRTVQTERGPEPYWNAGPAYGPWAGGYFGGGLLPGLLVGTVLGQMMFAPGAWGAGGAYGGEGAGGAEGGDFTGSDFGGGDWGGGGFGDGGGFGGGDFGGGGF